MKRSLLIAPLLLLPLTATALPNVNAAYSFSALDGNRDGRISLSEARYSPSLLAGFTNADLNGDGYIDRAEFARESASIAIRPPRG